MTLNKTKKPAALASLEKKIRESIKLSLEKLTIDSFPKTYQMIQSQSGYETIENQIISLMISAGYSAGGSISHLERML